MNIVIYSTTTCPYCKMLREHLDRNNIAYESRWVDQEESAKEEMMKASDGFLGVPFTVIKTDDGMEHKIVGFDKNKINSLVGIEG